MLDARFSHLYFCQNLYTLQRGLPAIAGLLFKFCYSHIRQLRCIRPYLDLTTTSTIATSIIHSKLDYCNSLYYNLSAYQLNCLKLIQNSLARAVHKARKSSHITPSLRSLHWLKIEALRTRVAQPTLRKNVGWLSALQPK